VKVSQQYLCPYITFAGRAREAMEFYQQALARCRWPKQPWRASLGFPVDRFGIHWMVSIER